MNWDLLIFSSRKSQQKQEKLSKVKNQIELPFPPPPEDAFPPLQTRLFPAVLSLGKYSDRVPCHPRQERQTPYSRIHCLCL